VGHQIYEFIKGNFTKRVVKDMYHMQVDKYNTIVTEIERKENMVNDLTQFLEDSIK
jgi:hypothetical protein